MWKDHEDEKSSAGSTRVEYVPFILLDTGGSLSIRENTCERREQVSMENIITNTKTMMGDRSDGCDCAKLE